MKIITMLLTALTVVGSTQSSFAEGRSYPCLDGIEERFDEARIASSMEFCSDFRTGWVFKIHPKGNRGHDGVLTNGTILRLFRFRQPDWKGGPNTLSFEFEPYKKNTWSIHIRDGDTLYKREGKRAYYVWARNIREANPPYGPYGNKWNPVRFLRCLELAETRCITYYDVFLCKGFKLKGSPNFPDQIEPFISIRANTTKESENLLEHFDLAHDLIEEALERLLEHSCQK